MTKSFNISYHGKRLRVVVLKDANAVVEKWSSLFGKAAAGDSTVDAFYTAPNNDSSYGAVYLPFNSTRLTELAIHEATHAAIAQARAMGAEDLDNTAEEHIALLAGALSARMLYKLNQLR